MKTRLAVVVLLLCVFTGFARAADAEDVFWDSVVKGNAREEYELYLKQYPKGRHAQEARQKIDAMRKRARAQQDVKKQEPIQAESAKKIEWPQAEEQAKRLYAEQEALKPESEAWRAAEAMGTTIAYKTYLEAYPNGRFSVDARIKLTALSAHQPTKSGEPLNSPSEVEIDDAVLAKARLISYDVAPVPKMINPGTPMAIKSTIVIYEAASEPRPVVEQQIVVIHDGKQIANARKRANPGAGGGVYHATFMLDLPKGVPIGMYPIETTLFVNGERIADKNVTAQVF